MEIKKFKYSAGQMLWDIILLFTISLILNITIIDHNANYKSWLLLAFALLLILSRFIYLAIMYFIPCMAGKTALELDIDKLQLFIKGKLLFQVARDIAYWKDIKDIDFTAVPRGSAIIGFTMKDGSAFGFRTKYIDGNDKEIYDTIMHYFKNEE
jgi:hypothetical protein